MNRIIIAIALVCAGISAQGRVLWDNNVFTDGNAGRAISPPGFPNIRVVDDIRVGGPGWIVNSIQAFVIEDALWTGSTPIDVYLALRIRLGPTFR